ncbi:MAG: TonB-dependent receptor [Bacteroidetes bacterium]|nr:TonB-dependent receptor [Bacteroidota bacterium]
MVARKILLCWLWIVSALLLQAQELKSIRGQVIDKDSKYPVVGASVVVLDTTNIQGTVTDDDGYFKLDLPLGRVSLRVSYIGYKDEWLNNLLVIAGKELNVLVELQEKVNQISEVVVSGKKEQGQAKNEFAVISARSFDVELTSRFSGNRNDPSRMASNFAGVSGANDARNDIIIRGNSPMGMLWRLEGIDIPSPNHFGGFGSTGGPVSMLNNNTLSRGDFITSAFPSEYGNALSGVFDLALRNGNKDKYEFMAQLGFNGIEAGAEGPFARKKSKASFLINYRYSTLALFKLLKANFGTGTAVPEYQDLTFKIDVPTKKAGVFRFWGLGGLSKIELLGSKVDLAKNPNNLYGNENVDIYNRVRTGVAGFSHTYFFNQKTYYKLMLAASHQTQLADIDSVEPVYRTEIVRTNKVALTQNKYTAHLLVNTKLDTKNTVTAGGIGNVYDIRFADSVLFQNRFVPVKDGKGYSALVEMYAMWKHKFTEQIALNAGAHLQYFSLSSSFAVEPRLSIKYQFRENQSVSVGYGMHHQIQPLPVYYNRDVVSMNNTAYTNSSLDFTRSQHVAVGYDLTFVKDFHLKAEAYFQYIDNAPIEKTKSSFSMLNAGADFATPNNTNLVNKGIGRNYGLEITLEKFMSKGFYFLVTGSLFQSQYQGSDKVWRNTAFNGLYVVNALAGYQYLFGGKKNKTKRHTLSIDMKMTGAGGRYYTPIDVAASDAQNKQVLIDSLAFTEKYRDYFRLDLKLSYRISFKKITQEFSMDLQNVANIKNIFRKVYNPRTNTLNNEYQQGLFILPQYRILF